MAEASSVRHLNSTETQALAQCRARGPQAHVGGSPEAFRLLTTGVEIVWSLPRH